MASVMLFLVVWFVSLAYGIYQSGQFIYKGDVAYSKRLPVLKEIVAPRDVNTLSFCAMQCRMYPQCKAIEMCDRKETKLCRLCNFTNSQFTVNDTDICRHLQLDNGCNETETCSKEVTKKLFRHSAFHAVSTTDQGIGVIVFKKVLSNIGYAYDSTTGIFIAHSRGIHIFSWSVETYGVRTDTVLEVNGKIYGRVTADENSSYYDTSTSFAVIELQKGDAVYIRVTRGTAKSTRTMFSGWQLSSSDPIPAFYASLTSRRNGPVFLFNQVYTNKDSVYTPLDGYFTAPQDGLYVFTSSVSIYGGEHYRYYIYTKGLAGPANWVSSSSGQHDNTGSVHVAYMSTGGKAYVGAGPSADAESGSMFAGWMAVPGGPCNYPAFIVSKPFNSTLSPIVFKDTHISPHSGFDSSTGIFTATMRGVYAFKWNVEAFRKVTTTSLRVNGVDKGQTRSDGRRTNFDNSAAVSVVELKFGDRVSVVILSGSVATGGETKFCGWLLFKL